MFYTDQSRIEAYLNRALTDDEGSIVEDVISHVSKLISSICNREWFSVRDEDGEGEDTNYSDEGEVRTFDGEGKKEIYIDDFIEATKIEFLDGQGSVYSTLDNTDDTDWLVFPSNKNPKESIRLRSGCFPHGYGNVEITAKWGSGQAPASVIMAATVMAGKFFKKAEVNKSTFKSESIEGYSYTLQSNADHDAEIQKALDDLSMYKKIQL